MADGLNLSSLLQKRKISSDQAHELRQMVKEERREPFRTFAVVSGKGGVGKTNLAVNLGLAFCEGGRKVVLLDADLGLANVDILFGLLTPPVNLTQVIGGERRLQEILVQLHDSFWLIPGGAGVQELADLPSSHQERLIHELAGLDERADVLIVDTAAGIHSSVLSFALAADAVILVTTPEPTAIRDAYGVLKALAKRSKGRIDVRLVVNMARDEAEAQEVGRRFQMAAAQFLDLPVVFAGYVCRDDRVREAVSKQRPLLWVFPDSRAARNLRRLADMLLPPPNVDEPAPPSRGIKGFLFRLSRRVGLGD